ncbi:RNA polymerase sigma-70 factor, ECF subfamily [Lentzea waywayandensis]|uniref:RNA polymerase sigma factor n=1 Tax=Lentzea waywayandensis TaxID=84724 RepID=A0A1I6FJ16_9PSEU|nr:sigma-70 family RNA polymerase sigma factor [Lentzea waywayandensis]SFR29888.1 RNA polymerase sigma-70 factor, ECF subfamily [Lentzea waywayandensis]
MRSPASARDEALVRSLYQEHGRALLAYVTRLSGGDWAVAEDVVQETLVRAWRHPEVIRNREVSVRAWLFTVARNVFVDKVRARSKRPQEVPDCYENQPRECDQTGDVLNSVVVSEALGRLSREHREVLVETYLHGHTIVNAASVLGIREGTARSRSYYAICALRELLSGQDNLVQE